MRLRWGMGLLSWWLVLLTGCAAGPQVVTLQPFVEAPLAQVGRGRELVLEVVDRRPSQTFGYLAGIGGNPPISSSGDLSQAVWQALADRLNQAQFVVAPARPGAPLALRVEILAVEYRTAGSPVINEVRTSARLQATARNGALTASGEFQADSARRVLTPPGMVDSVYMLNEVLSRALERMLQDPKLAGTLAG
ncbi:MAG TPA: YajG family lipoprotein [Candidatus Competibacteraceae bacterium]|nr:YajG family lipoprotein [Candidatus Competibacteraceae bacterium]